MTHWQDILDYWFGPRDAPDYPQAKNEMWWQKNDAIDKDIAARFGTALAASAEGALADWRDTPEGCLGHIILVDQMSRNMNRGSGAMFAQDDLGAELALVLAVSGHRFAHYHERMFALMPLMHAENVALQRLCVHLFGREVERAEDDAVRAMAENNLDFAVRHQVIVERFGRFPHRNDLLGRVSTAEEVAFLKEPGSSF